eukprot:CAMPEP_0167740742 /NCGR_PEP_ID=MMETSP0110_2-20121227/459_1 /TAXON_ID=629695 /ORGANISM="Gymnochlora sp., Strain CCMP2014" /LENGTH=981 /DNA_ID=CAMNT_0007624695 /DNA_START=276 /DNA_END=3222 /DNA_ORIENTATION=-
MSRKAFLKDLSRNLNIPLLRRVAALAIRVAKLQLPDGNWPELVPFLTKLMSNQNDKLRLVGMLMFRGMGENLGQIVVESMNSFAKVVESGLKDKSWRIRGEAFRAMERVVNYLDTKERVATFSKLIPIALQSMKDLLSKKLYDECRPALEMLHGISDSPVPVLEPLLEELVMFMLQISVQADELSIADSAMRFVQSVVEYRPNRMVRSKLVNDLLKAAFFCCVKDEENPFDVDNTTYQKIGVAMVAQLADSLPYKLVLKPCLNTAIKLMDSKQNPHQRRGGLAIIASIAESYSLLLQEVLPQLLKRVMFFLNDRNPYVRMAACVCLTQLCDHVQPDILDHHQHLIPAMVKVLDRQGEHHIVRQKIATAMCAFLEHLDKKQIKDYIKPLMTRYGQIVTHDAKMREMAISGIHSIATASEELFKPYFNDTMRVMLSFMERKEDEHLNLRARATDCIGAIAASVGPQEFEAYAMRVMHLAEKNFDLEYFSLNEATYRLYAGIAACMGNRFTKVLPKIVERTLSSALSLDGIEFKLKGSDMSAYHISDGQEESDEDFYNMVDFNVRTGAVDEKTAALQALGAYIEHCEQGFLPFVEVTLKTCSETLAYPYPLIRVAVSQILHEIVEMTYKLFPNQNGNMQQKARKILGQAVPLLLNMMEEEPDKGCAASACDGMKMVVSYFGLPILKLIGQKLQKCIILLLQEKSPAQAFHGQEEDGATEKTEMEIIDHVTDLLSAIAKTAGPAFEPMFIATLPHLLKFNMPHRSASDRIMSIGTIGDIGEELRHKLVPYLPRLIPIIIKALADPEVGVRRNAAYTIGIFAIRAGANTKSFSQNAIGALQPLFAITRERKEGKSQDEKNHQACRDNACSAVSKLMGADNRLANNQAVVDLFISGLPLLCDQEEAKEVYSRINSLLRTSPKLMQKHLPNLLYICSRALTNPHVTTEVKSGIAQLVRVIARGLGQKCKDVMSRLSNEQRDMIGRVLK